MTTLICYIDVNDKKAADALAEKTKLKAKKLSEIKKADASECTEIILLIHSDDNQQLDGYTPAELATTLSNKKLNDKPIILISCEAGKGVNPVAQQLSNQTKTTVYAATYPDDSPGGTIEIITGNSPYPNGKVQGYIKHGKTNVLTFIHDIEALQKPRNTYKPNTQKPSVSMDVLIALSYLYKMQERKVQGLGNFINEIEENPTMNQAEILSIVEKNSITHTELQQQFQEKYTTLGNPYQKLLSRLLDSGSIFQELWRIFYGTSEFTRSFRKKLYQSSVEINQLSIEINTINTKIGSQGLLNKLVQGNKDLLNKKETLEKKLKKVYEATGKEINDHIISPIDAYLSKYEHNTDELHTQKKEVMEAIKKYVLEPTEENWKKLKDTREKNSKWNQGLFSKVRFFMAEIEEAHSIKQEADDAISTKNP